MKTTTLKTIVLLLLCFIASSVVHQPAVGAEHGRSGSLLSVDTLDRFFELGQWSIKAEDTIHGKELDSDFVQLLVINYQQDTSNQNAVNTLGLLVLAEASEELLT